jgi:hypothetical protein
MDLTPYVSRVQQHLEVAAQAGGGEARALAERLTAPLESALRLTLLEALSAAASEITLELTPGSVEVRLRGLDPEFVVSAPAAGQAFAEVRERVEESSRVGADESPEGGTSRITLRLPDHLKQQVEQAAAQQGLSVNAWLIRAVSKALRPDPGPSRPRPDDLGGQRFTGWAR